MSAVQTETRTYPKGEREPDTPLSVTDLLWSFAFLVKHPTSITDEKVERITNGLKALNPRLKGANE